jgi:nucleoside-diphosphate-sugar epimerase
MQPSTAAPSARRALLAGASGLVGRALLDALLANRLYSEVHALLRRPAMGLPSRSSGLGSNGAEPKFTAATVRR